MRRWWAIALALGAAWTEKIMWINSRTTTAVGFTAIRNVVIHRGVQTLQTMRRLANVI